MVLQHGPCYMGVPAVEGLKFLTAKKKFEKCHLEDVPVGGSACWGNAFLGLRRLKILGSTTISFSP